MRAQPTPHATQGACAPLALQPLRLARPALIGLMASARLWLATSLALLLFGLGWARAADFLEPEKAFDVSASLTAPDKALVRIRIAPGYYLYREPIKIAAEGAALGEVVIPPGKVKYDENFQKNVETYRGELQITVAVARASGPFVLQVVSQGCADAGLCYPPMTSELKLDPAAGTAGGGSQAQVAGGPRALPALSVESDVGLMEAALSSGRFWQVVVVFLGLGALMSFTPCVLPMLPILSSLIVGADGATSRGRGLALATSYALGMAVVYTALGVAAGLAGEGMAAALQTPWAIGGFALVLVLLSLSMFGVYELRLPSGLTTHLHVRSSSLPAGRLFGVMAMGGLSALMVSPCVSAPLAGALLFISQSRDAALGGSALFAMAMGMSLPLLALGASAGRWLPKAGPWMHAVKQLFGLVMLAVAWWLAQPVLPLALGMLLAGALLLALAWWLKPLVWPFAKVAAKPWQWLGRGAALLALALGTLQLLGAATGGHDVWRPWSHWLSHSATAQAAPTFKVIHSIEELDAALRSANGRPTMLDFYADWCVSCKEMERYTFRDEAVAQRLAAAQLLKADVTANTEAERALLRRFKLFGPPGTLFFDARGNEVAAARVVGFQNAKSFGQTLDRAGL